MLSRTRHHVGRYWGSTGALNVAAASLPPGVTLQAIDGETMLTPTTMSNNYYTSNGFTFAANNGSYPGQSWDNPAFFPVAVFFGVYSAEQATLIDLTSGATPISVAITGPSDWGGDYSSLVTNQIQGYISGSGTDIPTADWGDWGVGIHIDEPPEVSDIQTAISSIPAASQAGRMWDLILTRFAIITGSLGTTINVALSTMLAANYFTGPSGGPAHRSIDSFSVDIYWFATANDPAFGQPFASGVLSIPMTGSPSFTATRDQMARGSHYGNMIDTYRSFANGTNSGRGDQASGLSGAPSRIPLWGYPENATGLWTSNPSTITPPEMNWAVWSSIIHGCRGISYFTYSSTSHGDGFGTTIQGGQSISIYNQAKATNLLIRQLAPVINSPFAKGFLSAVSPHGYIFPVYEQDWLNGGIEACAHWYQGGNITNAGLGLVNGFYIFATTRYGEAASFPVTATFTINDPSATSVNVVGESRSISISGGQFTDSFASAAAVHIYQVVG